MRPAIPIELRFYRYIDTAPGFGPNGDCHRWTGAKARRGYGTIRVNGHLEHAHRVAWKLSNKCAIPEGMFICHRCDNPPCVNDAHLFLGTRDDNMRDMVVKGRSREPRHIDGERNGNAKLTSLIVMEIRERRANGESCGDLAARFSVHRDTIYKAVSGKTYRE